MSTLLDIPAAVEASPPARESLRRAAALLELPEVRKRLFPLPVDAYIQTMEGEPTELLRGIILQRVIESPIHDYLVQEVREVLARQVSPEVLVVQKRALKFFDSVPEPDIAVLRGRKTDFKTEYPLTAELAVEVAVTSRSIDRAKALIYAEAKIPEYWIVFPEKKQVEGYRQPVSGVYTQTFTLTAPAVLHSSALPGVSIDLADLFA